MPRNLMAGTNRFCNKALDRLRYIETTRVENEVIAERKMQSADSTSLSGVASLRRDLPWPDQLKFTRIHPEILER
jgi:hypothetical protein